MGSAKKLFKKVGKSVGIGGGQKAADTVAMAEIATGKTAKSMTEELSSTPEQRAEAARRRSRRSGRRGLMMAGRLGGGGGQAGEDKNTLGSA